jgi:hypothetical protein
MIQYDLLVRTIRRGCGMCFTLSKIAPHDRWNWDGDHIIHECIVPGSRPVPGYPPKKSSYDIDVREFLVSERNEVMRKTLRKTIKSFVQTTPGRARDYQRCLQWVPDSGPWRSGNPVGEWVSDRVKGYL